MASPTTPDYAARFRFHADVTAFICETIVSQMLRYKPLTLALAALELGRGSGLSGKTRAASAMMPSATK
jgi:hypothetical protein